MFAIYGPGFTDRVRVPELLAKPLVRAASPIAETQNINGQLSLVDSQHQPHPSLAERHYQQADQQSDPHDPILQARQMMTTPVTTITEQATTTEALHYFESRGFRHLPVVSAEEGILIGMRSDRDLMHCICSEGISCKNKTATDGSAPSIRGLMQNRVLAAHMDADARYLARLFVEKRIGAVPIVDDARVVGIVTRSDVLRAVMVHFNLSYWR